MTYVKLNYIKRKENFMKKLYSLLLGAVTSALLFTASFTFLGTTAKAAGQNNAYWNYQSEKAVVSVYDRYSSSSSAFSTVTWKLLSEAQLQVIANSYDKTHIKLNRSFNSGDVILGMKTDNPELAFKAFQKMYFDGKTSPYLQLERLDYYEGTRTSIIIVRCDPLTETKITGTCYEFGTSNWAGVSYSIKAPKHDLKTSYYDTASMDKAVMKSYQYKFVKRPHSNISDICIDTVVAKKITGAPNASAYGSLLMVEISEKTTGTVYYNISYVYNLDLVAYKKGYYRKTYGYTSVDVYINNKKCTTYNFAK